MNEVRVYGLRSCEPLKVVDREFYVIAETGGSKAGSFG